MMKPMSLVNNWMMILFNYLQSDNLKNRLWFGFFVYSLLFLLVTVLFYPVYLKDAIGGLCLGAFYQWSLLKSVLIPPAGETSIKKSVWQSVGSLIRIVGIAFLIVWLGQGNLTATTIVIFGCLSYKGGALAEVVYQTVLKRG